jgi:hypothetical protein
VENIVKFQNQTNAYIKIVTYDQKSRRVLRNGLDHHMFKTKLSEALKSEVNKILPINVDSPVHNPPVTTNDSTTSISSPWRGWPNQTPEREVQQRANCNPSPSTTSTPVVPGMSQYNEVVKLSDSDSDLKKQSKSVESDCPTSVISPTKVHVNSKIVFNVSDQIHTSDSDNVIKSEYFLRSKQIIIQKK